MRFESVDDEHNIGVCLLAVNLFDIFIDLVSFRSLVVDLEFTDGSLTTSLDIFILMLSI